MTLLQPGVDEDWQPKRRAASCDGRHRSEIQTGLDSTPGPIRPSGVWLPRQARAPGCPQVGYVYLLVHLSENRFKIGKSFWPRRRIASLPEGDRHGALAAGGLGCPRPGQL